MTLCGANDGPKWSFFDVEDRRRRGFYEAWCYLEWRRGGEEVSRGYVEGEELGWRQKIFRCACRRSGCFVSARSVRRSTEGR